jgi:hypothetical protein
LSWRFQIIAAVATSNIVLSQWRGAAVEACVSFRIPPGLDVDFITSIKNLRHFPKSSAPVRGYKPSRNFGIAAM